MTANQSQREQALEARVRELEAQVVKLQGIEHWPVHGQTVRVPAEFQSLFDEAQQTVGEYFSRFTTDPSQATIKISDERYVLLRASSLSVDFLATIKNLYADYGEDEAIAIGRSFLFDISHVLGMEDAKNFHKKMGVKDPIAKLSAGPIHFAYSGWAFVDISPESTPLPNEEYFLKYDHPFSFEADSWIKSGQKSATPVCIMNSGYSSGWCEQSFGMPLTAVELSCKAAGDEKCTFIMAPPHKIEAHLRHYAKDHDSRGSVFRIPSFFERKRVEEEMKLARQKAEESDRMKSEFLANMSHEIRTPMNGIIGMTELMQDTSLTDTQREYLQATRDSAESLMNIINEVLDFSKIEAGAIVLEKQPFLLNQLLTDTLIPFKLRGQAKGVEVKAQILKDVPRRLIGDPGRLRQIIVNLVGNAVKFTEQGFIEILVSAETVDREKNNALLHFRVSDTGIGIPQEKQQDIFDAFTQVDMSTTRRFGGTGLGLTISSKLVQLMNGRIWCENRTPQGTVFHFVIQVNLDDNQANDPATADIDLTTDGLTSEGRAKIGSLKILVAEDGLVNQKLAIGLLESLGHSVTIAENGRVAVEKWQNPENQFDLILMDVLMPVLDGIEATTLIRQLETETGGHIPIIAVTAQAMKGDRESCLAAGMDDYVSKPIRKTGLEQVIHNLFD